MADPIRPRSFAHVVYRTWRYDAMREWYLRVFGAQLQHDSGVLCFLTYDDEHHRVALLNLGVVKGESHEPDPPRGRAGVDHVAYGFASLRELMEKYDELRQADIQPYWCIHHGITVSLYYADPDGNQMEFQVDCFHSNDDANAFMKGPHFDVNPIGVEFDPEDWLGRLRAGESEQSLLPRTVHLPVAPVRGTILG